MSLFSVRCHPGRLAVAIPGTVLVLATFPQVLDAKTWKVYEDGTGDAASIQGAIYYGSAGDTVLVWPGTYYENIDYLGKDVVLLAKFGPLVTTIDGTGIFDAVVTLGSGESRAAVLEGFTITAGQGSTKYSTGARGGGIMCYRSSPTIRGNRILGNRARTGGGIAVGNGQVVSPRPFPLIEGNLFAENVSTGNSGALSIEHADVIVRENVFRRNSCAFDGGAIRAYFIEGSAEIIGNEFLENEAGDHGGGLHIVVSPQGAAPINVRFNLIVGNVARGSDIGDNGSGGGVYVYGALGSCSNNTVVSNIGLGESPGSGGGLLIRSVPGSLEVRANIIALNLGDGIACFGENPAEIGPNLLWQNNLGDTGNLGVGCPDGWLTGQIIADPSFCNIATGDYTVASNSPAITGEEVRGAYDEPGCGPNVAVRRTTWGLLKALYR